MMSISSLLSDQPIPNNSKPFSRPSSASPPAYHSQFQKVIATTRPILSATNSYNSAFSTSPNLSESSNDENNGIIHQNFTNGYTTFDNIDNKINSNFHKKMQLQTVQILHHDFSSLPNPIISNNQFPNNLIPPLLLNNVNNQNSMKHNNQNSVKSEDPIISSDFDLEIPEPTYYDTDGLKYGIRCVCGDPHDDGFLVQCEKCEMWLHGTCINYTPNVKVDHFYCPYCLKMKIKCVCGKSKDYDLPLIQCQKCGNWSHKSCENIEFGRIPSNFICTSCRKLDKLKYEPNGKVFFQIPYVKFLEDDRDVIDITVFTSNSAKPSINGEFNQIEGINKSSIVASLPDGHFLSMIEEDLNLPEINFRSFMEKYFHTFSPLFFERIHEFFRVFNETVCAIFNINKCSVLRALDVLTHHLIYNQSQIENNDIDDIINQNANTDKPKDNTNNNNNYDEDDNEEEEDFSHSESITDYLKDLQAPRLEELPNSIDLYTDSNRARANLDINILKKNRRKRRKTENESEEVNKINLPLNDHYITQLDLDSKGGVYTPIALEDGAFIAEIPGFLIHTDEIKADDGIPPTSIRITDEVLFIDTIGTPFQNISRQIRRSFHFNCVVKMVRVKGILHAALFATRLQGPLSEEKTRRGDAIPANGELILPFDGDIPFPTEKIEWKERKKRKFNFGVNSNINNFCKLENSDFTNISSQLVDLTKNISFNNNNNSNSNSSESHNESNDKTNDSNKKSKKKITQQAVAKRCVIDPNLTLLSTFMNPSVPPMPFIILSDEEDIDAYKTQMERIKTRILTQ